MSVKVSFEILVDIALSCIEVCCCDLILECLLFIFVVSEKISCFSGRDINKSLCRYHEFERHLCSNEHACQTQFLFFIRTVSFNMKLCIEYTVSIMFSYI